MRQHRSQVMVLKPGKDLILRNALNKEVFASKAVHSTSEARMNALELIDAEMV
jgi:hypothetical protein